MMVSRGLAQSAWPPSAAWQAAQTLEAAAAAPPPPPPPSGPATVADLYMADPQIAALMAALGGPVAPATSALAQAQVGAAGQARFDALCRLSNALNAVRNGYTAALAQAAAGTEGPGWVDQPVPVYEASENMAQTGGVVGYTYDRRFDPDAFTAWYIQQDGLSNRAFGQLYGQSHTRTELDPFDVRRIAEITFDNPNWSLQGIGWSMGHAARVGIDLNHPPELNDAGAVGFDLEVGWATDANNLHRDTDWLDSAMQLAMVGTVAWLSAGTLGPAAAGALGLSTASAAGAAAAAAAVGAATSLAGGFASGELSVQGVLRGALSGALTAGLTQALAPGLSGLGAAGTAGLQGTVQGAVQALMGGSFREGAAAGLASGLAEVTVGHVEAGITQALGQGTMAADQVFQARMAARVLGAAIRALAGPDDAGRALAQGLLQEWLGQTLGEPGGGAKAEVAEAVPSGALLDSGQEARLRSGATVADFGDALNVAGEVTASAAGALRLDDGAVTVRRSGRTVYLGTEPALWPDGAAAESRRLPSALGRVLETAAQAQDAGLPGATGDPAADASTAPQPELALGSAAIRSLGGARAFVTFNPVGQLLAGVGQGSADLLLAPIRLGGEALLTATDAVGTAAVAANNLLTGANDRYTPDSALARTVESEGVLGALGLGVTGTVRGLLAPVAALYRQDLEALGRSLPGALLSVAPLGWGSRVSAAEGLTVEEAALVERGNPTRLRVIDAVTQAAQPAIDAILDLDPQAVVGFRGSLASGLKNPTKLGADKERLAYDDVVYFRRDPYTGVDTPYTGRQGYDLDLFAVSDGLSSLFGPGSRFRDLSKAVDSAQQLTLDLDRQLQASPLLGQYKSGKLEVRVWTFDEINRKLGKGEQPYFFNPENLP